MKECNICIGHTGYFRGEFGVEICECNPLKDKINSQTFYQNNEYIHIDTHPEIFSFAEQFAVAFFNYTINKRIKKVKAMKQKTREKALKHLYDIEIHDLEVLLINNTKDNKS